MKKLFAAVGILAVAGFAIQFSAAPAQALSCMPMTVQQQFDGATTVAIITPLEIEDTDVGDMSNTFTWSARVEVAYKGGISAGDEITFEDIVWPGGENTPSRLQADQEYLVYLNADWALDLCDYPREMDEPLTAEEQEVLGEDMCAPYVCKDGTVIASCSEDGHQIMYFAPPCLTHGGDAESASSSSRPSRGSFSDVSSTNIYAEAIAWAKAEGIVEGYSDGTFRPDSTINRAEFLKILFEAKNLDTIALCRIAQFPDASLDAWYGPYLLAARCKGIINGYPDGTVRPANPINFAEAAKIVANIYAQLPEAEAEVWYQMYVDYLADQDAVPVTIKSNGQLITRGEMVEMMYRLEMNTEDEWVACTMDAKMCPDGSYVGRIAPDCEFAACPGE